MKLLHCFKCNEIFSLSTELRECSCKLTSGKYKQDKLNAEVWTLNKRTATVLGFSNRDYVLAVCTQINEGDLPASMYYAGKIVSPGRMFDAFVIPYSADSVKIHYAEE